MDNDAVVSIKETIERAYIEGIHRKQDMELALSGFHRDFAMLVRKNESIEKVKLEAWIDLVKEMKKSDPHLWNRITVWNVLSIDICGLSAMAKLEVFKGSEKFSTDYMLLYFLNRKWTIVSKIFQPDP